MDELKCIKDKDGFYFKDGIKKVVWRNRVYDTGNRRHHLIELYKDGEFVRIASLRHCSQLSESLHSMDELRTLKSIAHDQSKNFLAALFLICPECKERGKIILKKGQIVHSTDSFIVVCPCSTKWEISFKTKDLDA